MAFLFDRETWLDISVNIIPMFIILFFVGVLLFTSPWPQDRLMNVVALGLHIVPFVLLALLTYVSALAIER
jgi:hypothetical protein